VTPLYPQKLALTSPTGCGCSVGMVRSRTKATEFSLVLVYTSGLESTLSAVYPEVERRVVQLSKRSYPSRAVIKKALMSVCAPVYDVSPYTLVFWHAVNSVSSLNESHNGWTRSALAARVSAEVN